MPDDATEKFSLKLTGSGIDVEKEVDAATAAAIVALAVGGIKPQLNPSSKIPASSASAINTNKSRISLREFLTKVGPNTINEKIATIGVYLHDCKSQDDFNKDDIEAGFKSAREPMPSNLTRDIGRTVGAGWLDESDKNGQLYVTNTGSSKVHSGFGRQSKSRN